jgi:hypothetical protein
MFYSLHVRVGNQVRVGYFVRFIKRPLFIGRTVKWLL